MVKKKKKNKDIGNPIVIGCTYRTTWQSNRKTFTLAEIKGEEARLVTKVNVKGFWTKIKNLIFISTPKNRALAGIKK